ncbi:MAG TPA: hypothetical protein VKT49_06760 [Bryobacteraceae bacterium]|nr:hypothetical protein [Bryobacteraceae bacterium]
MLIPIRTGKDRTPDAPPFRTGHKPLSLLYSVALHVGVVALLFLPASLGSQPQDTPYNSVVVQLEKDHKLVYYDFRKELPEVTASNGTAKLTTPSPEALKSKQTIVTSPREKPGKQLVYIPEPRVKLQTEITAPNLIAIETPVEVPLPDKPKSKPFQAPGAPKSAAAPITPLPNAPKLADASSTEPSLDALLKRPRGPVKQFTPPVANKSGAPTVPSLLPNAPAVGASGGENHSAIPGLLNKASGPPPRQFTPPAQATSTSGSTPAALPSAPAIASGGDEKESAVAALLIRPSGPVRQFTAPSGTKAGTAAAPSGLPNAPAVGGSGGSNNDSRAIAALLNNPGGPPLKPFTAPATAGGTSSGPASGTGAMALPAPPSVSAGGQAASATVAILGLNPANVPQIPRPEGSRPARIEAGTPVPGATRAELGGGNSGITLPDISIQGKGTATPAIASREPLGNASSPPATGLAHAQPPRVLPATPHVSVPLWPNTRALPPAVERHFQNRVAYVTLIPSDDSGDDWTIWFAEVGTARPDPNLPMHPPTLMKAGSLPPVPAQSDHGTGKIRLAGVIHRDGSFGPLAELTGLSADRELAEALQRWQFSPARLNGVTIDADAVIEIPVVFGKLSLR